MLHSSNPISGANFGAALFPAPTPVDPQPHPTPGRCQGVDVRQRVPRRPARAGEHLPRVALAPASVARPELLALRPESERVRGRAGTLARPVTRPCTCLGPLPATSCCFSATCIHRTHGVIFCLHFSFAFSVCVSLLFKHFSRAICVMVSCLIAEIFFKNEVWCAQVSIQRPVLGATGAQ